MRVANKLKFHLKKKRENLIFVSTYFLSFFLVQYQSEINYLPSSIDNHSAQMLYYL